MPLPAILTNPSSQREPGLLILSLLPNRKKCFYADPGIYQIQFAIQKRSCSGYFWEAQPNFPESVSPTGVQIDPSPDVLRDVQNTSFKFGSILPAGEAKHVGFYDSTQYVFFKVHCNRVLNWIRAFLILVFTVPNGISSISAISS